MKIEDFNSYPRCPSYIEEGAGRWWCSYHDEPYG